MKKPIKHCKNPDCKDEIVDYKSSKREYCSDYCRNHHGHKKRTEYNLEFTTHKNGMAKNYKVLKKIYDAGVFTEKLEKLIKMGFDPKYLPQKNIDNEFCPNIAYYIIKDIIFGLDPETDQVIIYSNEK
jgi:hypothetical protein